MGKLQDKIAVVTGGNSGIGLAAAKTFASEGAKVIIFGRNQETLDQAVAEIGNGAVALRGDVSNLADLDRLAERAKELHGKVDVVFANAGIAPFVPFEESDEALYDKLFNVNVKGAYFTVQKLLPLLGEGSTVIFNTSVVNVMGMPNASLYSATKAAVRSFVRTLAGELVGRGIRVNAVSPGPIETPIFDRMGLSEEEKEGLGEAILSQVPMQRMGQAEEIANAALFLASPESSYVLGFELAVDGGMSQV